MKKNPLYILVLIGVFAAILVPLILRKESETLNQTINISAVIISSLASIITLLIALFLFNKFGIESPLITKSSANVFSLLEKLKETNIIFSSDNLYFQVQMSNPFKYNQYIESYYSEKVIFPQYYLDDLVKLFEISDNPFTPQLISEKVDRLRFQVLSFDVDTNKVNDYLKIRVVGGQRISNEMLGRFNGEDFTVLEFLTLLDDIATEIKSWLQKNSSVPVNLNL